METDYRKKLVEKSSLTDQEVKKKVKEKMQESALPLSKNSAAILVGRDNGIELVEDKQKELDIENIVPEMRSFTIEGEVEKVKEEYNPSGEDYRVTSVKIRDETGKTEVSFWNQHSDQAQKLVPGHHIKVTHAYTKENPSDYQEDNYGVPGVNLSDKSKVKVYKKDKEAVLIEPE